jgi:single stranded DNA-binding protein
MPKGTAIADLGLAINRTWTEEGQKREEVTFVDVTLWARLAEIAQQYLKKGYCVVCLPGAVPRLADVLENRRRG